MAAGPPDSAGISAKTSESITQELPVRYTCQLCGVCIATSEFLLDAHEDVVVFARLHFEDRGDRASRTLPCPYCDQGLGTRAEGAYVLRKDRILRRPERLEVLVCSLKQQEVAEVSPALREAFPHSNINTRILLKAELRGFQLSGLRPVPDLVVVVHRNEGRVLLTDRNGFYHDVLGSAWQQTRGNILVILTRAEPKVDGDLYDVQLLQSLSMQGDQPTVGALGSLGRVLTWDSSPSKPQQRQLQTLTARAYFREPSVPVHGIPSNWAPKKPQPKLTAANWCSLL